MASITSSAITPISIITFRRSRRQHYLTYCIFRARNYSDCQNDGVFFRKFTCRKKPGNPPVNLPLLFTTNRINLEANLYKNLYLATGLELQYNTPYKRDNYSPFIGQFFYQDSYSVTNRPVANVFFDFSIKSFKAYIRAENLNSLNIGGNSVGFTAENELLQHYYDRGLWIRFGFFWGFVN